MHERVRLCETQTEFDITRESLGVSRVCRIFRVDVQTILEEENAAGTFDEVELVSLDRLCPRVTEDHQKQTTPSAGQSGFER